MAFHCWYLTRFILHFFNGTQKKSIVFTYKLLMLSSFYRCLIQSYRSLGDNVYIHKTRTGRYMRIMTYIFKKSYYPLNSNFYYLAMT